MDAQGLIDALRKAGFPVKELKIADTRDPSTWTFVGLDDDQTLKAIAFLNDLLNPIVVPPPRSALTVREFWLMWEPDEYVALAKTTDPATVRLKAVLRAAETFLPTEYWVFQFLMACAAANVLTRERADALYSTINPPV